MRLDAALAERGLARSRTHAARLIAEGLVSVDGQPVVKPSARVDERSMIELAPTDTHVSRAALKLIAGLEAFPVPVEGRLALDVGASTGGFTQVLLERGAATVIALDVGHGQLAPSIRSDRRVRVVEGANARYLTADSLAELSGVEAVPDLVVADLSFISLRTVLPALVDTVGAAADLILLIKPQFEVGRHGIREGVVRDAALRRDAVEQVLWAAWDVGLPTAGLLPSPIVGASGNREYLAWFSGASGRNPTEWLAQLSELQRQEGHP
jgi:23S rRNA (cytidine1920-2'-O)/16S rRNA (cytidine1409-2'-O)-methyltransferase